MEKICLSQRRIDEIKNVCRKYGNDPGELINILHGVQDTLGYLPKEVQELIALELGISAARVYGVVSFYSFFTMKPKGKYPISVCMLFVASPKYLQFIIVAVAVVVFAVAFVMLAGYRSTRIEAWLHPETAGTDAVFQTMMGLYAIGSGGLFGKGLGESLQKLGNVPESQNDMIFTIICEELGLFGAICLILLFILLIWRMMVIANNARDLYGSLLVIGVMSHIAIQVILNIAVVTNSLPNTGVILPFISYGGTSIIFLMAEIGLVLSVSRGIRLENV